MKIVEINSWDYASTGNICFQIADAARLRGHEAFIATPQKDDTRTKESEFIFHFGSSGEVRRNLYAAGLTGNNGFFSKAATKKLVARLEELQPDLVHLHNLHGYCFHLPTLFAYLKKSGVKVVWTLHDCWTFTGRCPHFTISGCERWRTGCGECVYPMKEYPISIFDRTRYWWKRKKDCFCSLPMDQMTVVTPSDWLAGLAKESYLGKYPVKTIHNGIDLSIFHPTESEFRKKQGLERKKIYLGVSFGWGYAKGLDVFLELQKRLDSDEAIVLVGTDEETDKSLPPDILSIHITHSKEELAQIYSAADLFLNPTREDTFPTVNIEALACGLPVVTFRTGGSPEIPDKNTGIVVDYNDIDTFLAAARRVAMEKPFSEESCTARARKFEKFDRANEYIDLFESLILGGERA